MEKTFLALLVDGSRGKKYITPQDLVQASADSAKPVSLEFAQHMIALAKGIVRVKGEEEGKQQGDNNKRQRLTRNEFVNFFGPPDP
eukprot:scaffold16595_cov232-Amphora_coffeaeformis.AAC.4